MEMKKKLFRLKVRDDFLAVFLTLIIITLLFLLKYQEDQYSKNDILNAEMTTLR